MHEFEVEVEVTRFKSKKKSFEVGDEIGFGYLDINSKTMLEKKGTVVGFWDGYPALAEDGIKGGTSRKKQRILRLNPEGNELFGTQLNKLAYHPNKDGYELAWAEEYRYSDEEPRARNGNDRANWRKRGHGLGEFNFGVPVEHNVDEIIQSLKTGAMVK